MGHLVNPAGFRVGYFSNWLDVWATPNHLIYSEMLHNTVSFRKVMHLYFENFITDRYSILYSHFTVEGSGTASVRLKMYFYDGIVEEKVALLERRLKRFRRKKRRWHRYMLKKFLKIKRKRRIRSRILRYWRYYDYTVARQIIFYFVYFLNMGRRTISIVSKKFLGRTFIFNMAPRWFKALRKDPGTSVFTFIKYYVKFLALKGFDRASARSKRLHVRWNKSNPTLFLRALDEMLFFWRKQQNRFGLLLSRKKILYRGWYAKYIKMYNRVHQFCGSFFTDFYRLYLLQYRQSKFYRFMLFILNPIFAALSILPVKVEFFGIDNNSVTAIFLARYIARKIEMKFTIRELFNPISREMRILMRRTPFLLGYKLQFVGRLTRRGKVRTTWRLGGSIPASSMDAQIEHAFYLGILRNGACSVRVWLYRHKSFGNYNYNYIYRVRTEKRKQKWLAFRKT